MDDKNFLGGTKYFKPLDKVAQSSYEFKNEQQSHSMSLLADIQANEKLNLTARVHELKERMEGARAPLVNEEVSPENRLYREEEFYRPVDELRSTSNARKPFSADTANDYARIIHSPSFRLLQGKSQLFPIGESEVLRTRLTHSLEVAEIAARIVAKINSDTDQPHLRVDPAIVAAAGLSHDLGHPPFGHSGEKVLNQKMAGNGGFEGNAQTLRILTRLENRFSKHFPRDQTPTAVHKDPKGLNLLYRTIASVVKYDRMISRGNESERPPKGYYEEDEDIVQDVKARVIRSFVDQTLKTIECQVMDFADDIAYSTYDLEDCMIAGVCTPLDLLSCSDSLLEVIAVEVTDHLSNDGYKINVSPVDVQIVFLSLFEVVTHIDDDQRYEFGSSFDRAFYVASSYQDSLVLASNPILRRRFSEVLINRAISSVQVYWNATNPELSKIDLGAWEKLVILCLKSFNYQSVIRSQRLQVHERKCKNILETIFDELCDDNTGVLFDEATAVRYKQIVKEGDVQRRLRFICDYIASLTDTRALALYSKLRSENTTTVFGLYD